MRTATSIYFKNYYLIYLWRTKQDFMSKYYCKNTDNELNYKRFVRNRFRWFCMFQSHTGINNTCCWAFFLPHAVLICYSCQVLTGIGSLQREDEDQQQKAGQNHPRIISSHRYAFPAGKHKLDNELWNNVTIEFCSYAG